MLLCFTILFQRLKDKLGTRQVPTAELLLDGTKAFMVNITFMLHMDNHVTWCCHGLQVSGSKGRGVANISPMLTITRLHNSISAVGAMRRYAKLNNHSSLIITDLFETLYTCIPHYAAYCFCRGTMLQSVWHSESTSQIIHFTHKPWQEWRSVNNLNTISKFLLAPNPWVMLGIA